MIDEQPASARVVAIERYKKIILKATEEGQLDLVTRKLCQTDLFFLGMYVLGGITFANKDWVFDRCREFQADPDGYLDLWPREHFKSTIITLWAVVQRILNDPEITIGIFSFKAPIAKGFLRAIKWQFESNERLKELFPDILYADPGKESPKWSEDDGLIVKRTSFPKESTVEAHGIVEGQPTSKHFGLLVYDDTVVPSSVSTPEMITKTNEAISLSFNLGKEGGARWMAGTRYHMADTYSELIRRGAVKLRLYAATRDGTFEGEPVLWTRARLAEKIHDQGTYVASCQLFNNPIMEGEQTFVEDWIQYWIPREHNRMNKYILVDPANAKTKRSDYTVILVIGLGPDKNYYLIDGYRDKLSIRERSQRVMALHAQYRPLMVGYEKYGIQTDIDFLEEMQNQQQYRFKVTPLGGSMGKVDRIKRLQPIFEAKRFYIPEKLIRVDYQGKPYDLTQSFINDEYLQFPYMSHDDMLDCMARITDDDIRAFFPSPGKIDSRTGKETLDDDEGDSYNYDTYAYLDSK